ELFAAFENVAMPDIDRTRAADPAYRAEIQPEIDKYIEAKTNAAKAFVTAHPADERAAALLAELSMMTEGDESKQYVSMLLEHHPDHPSAAQAKQQMELADKIGQPFELSFTDVISGDEISVQDDLRGKVVVIDFWATWCGPCIAEMPKMKKLYAEYKDKGVEFIGVSLDDANAKDKLVEMIKEDDLSWKHYFQGNGWASEFSQSWGISGIPTLFIIDADGKLVSMQARGQLETMIPELLEKRDNAEQASAQ
ncbi:MAG: TlpA disulfide reductase family protein, partial [Planctomycetota bacterium]